ncbi:RNA-directed DNA polymerase, eukaryota [Tanacetum coccineum]|uniref:RNA-directed DNA polymerase, eukaryota n=1 Tax=Tanacetum coccineum TaxID=301880 RepID=A0ABQ5HRX0_9ASTR
MSIRELLFQEKLHKALQVVCEKLNQQEQAPNVSTHTPEPSRRFNIIYDYDDDDQENTIPLNEITSQIPPSIAITPILPTMEPEDSLIIGDENLSTISEKESDEVSSDPFNIYDLLDKRTKEVRTTDTSTSIPYPPGFTHVNDIPTCNNQDIPEAESVRPPSRSARSNSRVLEEAENSMDRVSSESFLANGVKIKEGGLGSKAKKDWIKELISKHKLEGFSFTWAHPSATKMSKLDRPIFLLKEVFSDFGPTPFHFYHSWLELPGFDDLVSKSWNSFTLDDYNGLSKDLKSKLCDIDKVLDQGGVTDDILLSRLEVLKQLHDVQSSNNRDIMQKAKIRWAIEGDENSKYFHAIINNNAQSFSLRFQDPGSRRGSLNFPFPNRLNNDQILELESPISNEDIRTAVWGYVKWFLIMEILAIGCNSFDLWPSSLNSLIRKLLVTTRHQILVLIGKAFRKVVTKILASRLSLVISDLISDVQTAFLPNRQILDGPFIINEILARCKLKKQQAMIFKVDFAKAYDSVRWDYLDDVLISFGFGPKWR